MPVGQINTVAQTADFKLTRDGLIIAACQHAGCLPEGESITPEMLVIGMNRLGMIVREIDQSGKWVWTTEEAIHLPLASGVGVYDVNNGLPNNVSELVSVVYRSANGYDSSPIRILKAEGYEEIRDKLMAGEPNAVYLTTDIQLERRRLYVWPFLSTVTVQSKVVGTDNNVYKCIYPHTSSSTNQPTSGPNWRMVWELSAASVTPWTSGTDYTTAESLRIVMKRPIFDFDSSSNTPDFPMQWTRLLMLRLAQDMSVMYKTTSQDVINGQVQGAFTDIFPSTRPKSNDIHNKVQFF